MKKHYYFFKKILEIVSILKLSKSLKKLFIVVIVGVVEAKPKNLLKRILLRYENMKNEKVQEISHI
jgi:hypothetical protein